VLFGLLLRDPVLIEVRQEPSVYQGKGVAGEDVTYRKAVEIDLPSSLRHCFFECPRALDLIEFVVLTRNDQHVSATRVVLAIIGIIPIARDSSAYAYHTAHDVRICKCEPVIERNRLRERKQKDSLKVNFKFSLDRLNNGRQSLVMKPYRFFSLVLHHPTEADSRPFGGFAVSNEKRVRRLNRGYYEVTRVYCAGLCHH